MIEKVKIVFLNFCDSLIGDGGARELQSGRSADQRVAKVQKNISAFPINFEIKKKYFLQLNFKFTLTG